MSEEVDIFSLNIRIIDSFYKLGKDMTDISSRGRIDMCIFYLDNSKMKILKIQEGLEILKEAVIKVFGSAHYKIPLLSKNNRDVVWKIISTKKPEELRFPKKEFKKIANKFVEEYALGRLESEIMSSEEYISFKQNMPCERSRSKKEKRKYDYQQKLTDELGAYIREAPQIIFLPPNPKKMYKEVRLDNKLSRCIFCPKEYEKLNNGDNSPNTNLTICDFVFQYSPKEFYVIETKVRNNSTKIDFLTDLRTCQSAKNQLGKASLFFQKNFNVYPTLVRVVLAGSKNNEKIKSVQYKFFDGEFHQIKRGLR